MDWRLPGNRREALQRSYTFSLVHGSFPGMVYSMLPALADELGLDDDQRAWLVWLNGNTQNVVTSYLLLKAAPWAHDWREAVAYWNDNFKALEWDTDRRHQKSRFGEATEAWASQWSPNPARGWESASEGGWRGLWAHALGQPYMGRISAWSMYEYARILLPGIPDVGSWFLEAPSSRSHRNALALLAGHEDAWGWDGDRADEAVKRGLLPLLNDLAEDLLLEAYARNPGDDNVSRLTLESALCSWKSWHKPNRRYPGVYADMMYDRIRRAEDRFDRALPLLWDIRARTLPAYLRQEADTRYRRGVTKARQNCYRETGTIPDLCYHFHDMAPTRADLDQGDAT